MHVFGYGSLLELDDPAAGPPSTPCTLLGWRRGWGAAMDNSLDLPGYKRYLDGHGARPAVFVAFLDITPRAGAAVNGLALPVDAEALAALDARERNYDRIEVGGELDRAFKGPVWAYVGSAAARARRRAGADQGRLVVVRSYHERVRGGFARLGGPALAQFEALTDPLPGPVLDLRRVDSA